MKNIRPHSFRNGSALLIVLGMLAFMVVSAVAFSAYMRASRLPSSYLRRTVASRLLVKAALAEAMERLDYAIGDNPYPGVGVKPVSDVGSRRRRAADISDTLAHNYFYHHVFIGTNGWLAAEDTVSVLNLEALAYLPPPLVNEARYYSRLSPAATWHWLSFDAGRYAYAAIDVSDYFDVNRLAADLPRDSGANRISLAYLFENKAHTGYEVQPQAWDDFVDRCFSQSGGMPFVSVADLNLAMGDSANSSPVKSPFCEYIAAGTKTRFVSSSSKDEQYRNLAFVTDSYFPAVAANGDIKDLANPDGQPFPTMGTADFVSIFNASKCSDLFSDFGGYNLVNLWDYLDTDSIPLSLSLPTVEQSPMVVRLEPAEHVPFDMNRILEAVPSPEESLGGDIYVQTKTYKIKNEFVQYLQGILDKFKVQLVYPFKYVDEVGSYEVEASASVFFCTSEHPNFRNSNIYPGSVGEWFGAGVKDNAVFRIVGKQTYKPVEDIAKSEEALGTAEISFDFGSLKTALNNPAFYFKEQYKKVDGEIDESSRKITEAKYEIFPVDASGNIINFNEQQGNVPKNIANLITNGSGKDLYPCVAIAVRVKDVKNGKYVDLVPAGAGSDELNGGISLSPAKATALLGAANPILPFHLNQSFRLDAKFIDDNSGQQATVVPEAIFCPDPRYNHNPEDWADCGKEDKWLDKCGVGAADRDTDIFMAVSNQGYLQSIYELAFLPRLKDFSSKGVNEGTYRVPAANGNTYGLRTNAEHYWQTYSYINEGDENDLTNAFPVVSGSASYKVNPYAQSLDSIMAAFANTPCCWAAASTNQTKRLGKESDSAAAFNKRYTFQELKWEDLEDIASEFQQEAQQQARDGRGWENAWEDLDWDAKDSFLGIEGLPALHSVDRKFLYGYWRDSFANQQQLFLVFVRAEPTMMGGGAVGQTPPALGARAVALVWRDPEAAEPNEPHRMRILFYRQFE